MKTPHLATALVAGMAIASGQQAYEFEKLSTDNISEPKESAIFSRPTGRRNLNQRQRRKAKRQANPHGW